MNNQTQTNNSSYNKVYRHNFDYETLINYQNTIALSLILNANDVEKSAKQSAAYNQNKNQHCLNGNRSQAKTKKHIKVYQLNKGNSKFGTYRELILDELSESKADIAILGESNMVRNEPQV